MAEQESLRLAVVDLDLAEWLKPLCKEFNFLWEPYQTDKDAWETEFLAFHPDLVISSPNSIEKVHENFPEGLRPTCLVAVSEQENEIPDSVEQGLADDVLTLPVRRLELLSRIRWHYHLQVLRHAEGVTSGVQELVEKLEEDLVLAQKIQRRLIREHFPPMPGLSIKSKYWCGMASGGDYFDIYEYSDKNHVGFLLTDSSSYKLSSSLLSALMHLSAESLVGNQSINPLEAVRQIFSNVQESMKPKDALSIFFGILDRKSYVMQYVSFGSLFALHQKANGDKEWLFKGDRDPLLKLSQLGNSTVDVQELVLEPADRFLLFSNGFEAGIDEPIVDFIEQLGTEDAQEVVNEIGYALKKERDKSDDNFMPPEDCSLLMVDVAKNVLRLAR